jgi:hypothetical protein
MIERPLLTEEIAYRTFRDFFREKPLVFFGTGMSCALDQGFGMDALKNVLIREIAKLPLPPDQQKKWNLVVQLLKKGVDLEQAMDHATDVRLVRKISIITSDYLSKLDGSMSHRIASDKSQWPAINMVSRLVESLPNSDPILHVITPNYDLLFEYACDKARILYTSGLYGGVIKRRDWQATSCALKEQSRSFVGKKAVNSCKYKKHIRLYKVHGSLNYFFYQDELVENNTWICSPPSYADRVIITPGLSKYQFLHKFRQELLQPADKEIEKSSRFLFMGYGFNDNHLEEYITRKLITQACQGLIITRDTNPRIEAVLAKASNLWLICRSDRSDIPGSRIFNNKFSDWLYVRNDNLWVVNEFNSKILGG